MFPEPPYVYTKAISAAVNFDGMPAGQTVLVACDGPVTVRWWCASKGDYNAGEEIDNPGAEMTVPSNKVRFEVAGLTSIDIILKKES